MKLRVLLIDEVDVFFSKDFFGNTYLPEATLKDQTVIALLDVIWRSKEQGKIISYKDLIKS